MSTAPAAPREVPPPASAQALKEQWARLITQAYEADPLLCPQCGGPMRIIASIGQPEVIEKILTHLGLWPAHAHGPPGVNRRIAGHCYSGALESGIRVERRGVGNYVNFRCSLSMVRAPRVDVPGALHQ